MASRDANKQTIDTEVVNFFGDYVSYSPRKISGWLRHWHETFTSRETSWWRATVEADIRQAVGQLPPHIQLFFELYCVQGLTYSELWECARWSTKTCNSKWSELQRGVIRILCDTRVIERTPRGRGPVPRGYAGACEGKFDCVLPLRKS